MGTKHDLYWQSTRKFIDHHNNSITSSSVNQSASKKSINSSQSFKTHNRKVLGDVEPGIDFIDSRFKELSINSDTMDPVILGTSNQISNVRSYNYTQETSTASYKQVPSLVADFEMEQAWNNSVKIEQSQIHQAKYQKHQHNTVNNNRTSNFKPEPIVIKTSQTDIEMAADEVYDLYLPQVYAQTSPLNLISQQESMDLKQTARLRLLRLKNQLLR